jgi:LuxR family maltose regulon positive regulatory protein
MVTPLISTKLHIPPAGADLISRPHLLKKLDDGLQPWNRMILVCAPVGSGKSTLLSLWLESHKEQAAWLSLDDGDNDPIRFLTYLVTAVQNVEPDFGRKIIQLLHASKLPTPSDEEGLRSILTLFINEAALLTKDIILVLEDFQVISSPVIHDSLAFFMEHLPLNVKLVISTRTNPPLPVARLRASGELTELRLQDLRFTLEEAHSYLNEVMKLELEKEDVNILTTRTEGWAAGLKLAALSMGNRSDKHEFITSLTGSNRYIFDYLSMELLEHQPESIRSFLLETSILRNLCASLCNRVTYRDDSTNILAYLQQINSFIIPLDDHGNWFRYHHLFADFLYGRLQQVSPDRVSELHNRAVEWYDLNNQPEEAIYHASVIHDFEKVEQLILKSWKYFVSEGGVVTVLNWLNDIPGERVRLNPLLNIARCQVLCFVGQMRELESSLDYLEETWMNMVPAEQIQDGLHDYETVPAQIAILRSFISYNKGDFDKGISFASQALKLMNKSKIRLRGWAYFNLACAYQETGRYAQALKTFTEPIDLLQRGKIWSGVMYSFQRIAQIQQLQGYLDRAFFTCQEGLRILTEENVEYTPGAAAIYVTLSDILRERNELLEAEDYLQRALELSRLGGDLYLVKDCNIAYVKMKLMQGDMESALAVLNEMESAAYNFNALLAIAEIAAYRARVSIAQGKLVDAARWMEEAANRVGQDNGYTRMVETLTIIRVLIAQNRHLEAIDKLKQFISNAENHGCTYVAIEALILRAVIYRQLQDIKQADTSLERALELAEPENYIRIFINEGKPVEQLLRELKVKVKDKPHLSNYITRLLYSFEKDTTSTSNKDGVYFKTTIKRGTQTEIKITKRELHVLQLICAGYSNRQISNKLVITLDTVKKHASNIFNKLGVNNRSQAIIQAHQLGITNYYTKV